MKKMPEEKETEEVVKPTYMEEVKNLKDSMEKTLEENKRVLQEMKDLRAEQILSGNVPVNKPEVKQEEDPVAYLKRIRGMP